MFVLSILPTSLIISFLMILKIQNFCEKKIPLYPSLGLVIFFHRNFEFLLSLKIVSQYELILNLISHTGWMGSIDLLISRQNPSIETTTSG